MKSIRFIGLIALSMLCAGCGSAPAHLDRNWISAESHKSVTIVYMDPAEPLSVLRYYDGNTAINGSNHNDIEEKVKAYMPWVAGYDPIARNYETVHAMLSTVPWLQNADWRRIPYSRDMDTRQLVKRTGTDVVITIYPHTVIYADGDPLAVRCEVSVYAGGSHVDSSTLDAVGALGPDGSDSLPNSFFHNQYLRHGYALDQQLSLIFANDGIVFKQAYAETQARLRALLWLYFTDTERSSGG